jgi:hypothetical protein
MRRREFITLHGAAVSWHNFVDELVSELRFQPPDLDFRRRWTRSLPRSADSSRRFAYITSFIVSGIEPDQFCRPSSGL